ncbi:MAG: hypothetical protein JSR24_12560 [Proteobacteria bacterium]|nr:hypothetical protein [Pseudomonadota bacterium]
MFEKSRKILLIGGLLAAVSFGGSALAVAGAAPVQPTKATVAPATEKADGETADGAQGPADTETTEGNQESADTVTNDSGQFGNNEADEEGSDGGAESESGTEVPGNDGPGGHHDEPGNPNAQHEASGRNE